MSELLNWRADLSRRRSLVGLAALALAVVGAPAHAAPAASKTLPLSQSLAQELQAALMHGKPLVVMVSLKGCPWCELVRSHYLAPMHDREGLPVVQLNMLDARTTHDFDGREVAHADLIKDWQIQAAPTLLFFGAGGREVARRLEGVSPDFYAAQLDSRLQRARVALMAA